MKRPRFTSSPVSFVVAALALIATTLPAADLVPVPALGLRAERGFEVTLFADNDLAPDTWCMTLDSQGRVVVANGQSIRTLVDDDGDNEADRAIEFARVSRGVMGMCFDGTSLFVSADGWLQRYEDANGDSVADGPPQRLVPLALAEHGGHAMRKGPDGWWYLIGGNDTGFTADKHATLADSPITKPEAGALLRLTPDASRAEIIAHGFRNPYDFDFSIEGDVFTYDSDVERDAFLPWYMPTRVYHVGYGQHHGWRLPGYQRSWPRPDYYLDNVSILAPTGRGSPTGVAAYRHFQFPEEYRGGLFLADWTFGRIYFLPLEPSGGSYAATQPEVFIEPIGTHGFAPTDLAVGADGSLFVSIGGRKTRGAVYRVNGTGRPALESIVPAFASADLNNVLVAAQPLDAWSRALWMPAATRLGAQPLLAVATDESVGWEYRVRAIEVLTEMFGGLPVPRARFIAQSSSPEVRARVAWSLGRAPNDNVAPLLLGLAADRDPRVRRCALESISDQVSLFASSDLSRVLQTALADVDRYARMAAIRLAADLPLAAWNDLTTALPRNSTAVNAAAIAQTWRSPDTLTHPAIVGPLTNLITLNTTPAVRLEAVRLLMLAFGDWKLNNPSVEVYSGYELAVPPGNDLNAALRRVVRALLPSTDARLNMEAARFLAMLEDDDRRTPVVLMSLINENTSATADFHFLACLSRLRVTLPELAPRISTVVLSLERKLRGQESRVKQNWNVRLGEVVQQLVRRDAAIADALLRHPQLTTPSHVFVAHALEGEKKLLAARRFLAIVKADASFAWSSELVALLNLLPAQEVAPIYRRQWHQLALRDDLLPRLAEQPIAADRDKFLAALSSAQPTIVRTSVEALLKLPPDASGTNLAAPLKLLGRAVTEPQAGALRQQLVTLITNSLKQAFPVQEPADTSVAALQRAYQPLFNGILAKYPGLARVMNAEDNDDPARWNAMWRGVRWDGGDATLGAQLFVARACAACHRAEGQIGPDLAGAAQRFSPEDLMNAVVFPSRDIAPAYRAMTFRLRNGESYTGTIAFESADGWILHTGPGSTVRVNSADVISRQPSPVSLMPSGLLNGLSARDIAHLYAYMRTLQAQ
jgi:putative membrane-bound dehydrogenase-like protein